MNKENLKVEKTETALTVLSMFASRERIGAETTIDPLRSYFVRKGISLPTDELYKLFSELEESGVGELQPYLGNPTGKFMWYYSLRDVSKQILNMDQDILIKDIHGRVETDKKRPKGRPKGYSPKFKQVMGRELPKDLPRRPTQTRDERIFVFTTDSGDYIPFKIHEAERLIAQVNSIKLRTN